jgi:hypothetical protein
MKTLIAWLVRRNNDFYSKEVEAMKFGAAKKTDFQLAVLLESNSVQIIKLIILNEIEIRKRIRELTDSILIGTIPTIIGVILGFSLGLVT